MPQPLRLRPVLSPFGLGQADVFVIFGLDDNQLFLPCQPAISAVSLVCREVGQFGQVG